VWLARLRIHQSRDDEALRLSVVTPAVERDPIAATFRLVAVGHALGHLGRPADALARFDELDRLMDEIGYRRYEGTAHNWRAWLLRYLGEPDAARDHNEQAESISRTTAFNEGIAHAMLDRADLAVLGGDLTTANEWLDRAEPYHDMGHPMRWRHALRGRLLRAHLDLLGGEDRDRAAEGAQGVVEWARDRGVERYEVLGGLVAVMAGARPTTDLDDLVGRLPVVAGTEAWWWLARLHEVTGDRRWQAAAERSVADLLPRAGDHRDALATFARSTTTRGR
jgi:tetratricopeptide (TPR) repeat protein